MPSTIAPRATTTSVPNKGPPASWASSSDNRPLKPDTWIRPTINPIAVTITMIEADIFPALTNAAYSLSGERKLRNRSNALTSATIKP